MLLFNSQNLVVCFLFRRTFPHPFVTVTQVKGGWTPPSRVGMAVCGTAPSWELHGDPHLNVVQREWAYMCISSFVQAVFGSWVVETSHGVCLQIWTAVLLSNEKLRK